jgi:hypothetical protein
MPVTNVSAKWFGNVFLVFAVERLPGTCIVRRRQSALCHAES